MNLDNKIKEEILDILDNVMYWETCPPDYIGRIDKIKLALTIPISCEQLKDKETIDFEQWKINFFNETEFGYINKFSLLFTSKDQMFNLYKTMNE